MSWQRVLGELCLPYHKRRANFNNPSNGCQQYVLTRTFGLQCIPVPPTKEPFYLVFWPHLPFLRIEMNLLTNLLLRLDYHFGTSKQLVYTFNNHRLHNYNQTRVREHHQQHPRPRSTARNATVVRPGTHALPSSCVITTSCNHTKTICFRKRATGIWSCSRYLVTVRRAIRKPFSASMSASR